MKERPEGRLISASEVERWSYCPLSWYLDRNRSDTSPSIEDSRGFAKGDIEHERMSEEALGVINAQKHQGEARMITTAFLFFALVLFVMGSSMAILAGLGVVTPNLWSILLVFISLILISISLAIYFRRARRERMNMEVEKQSMSREKEEWGGWNLSGPFLFYILGALMMVNGLLILRPFGMGIDEAITSISIVLFAIYFILLGLVLMLLIRPKKVSQRRVRSIMITLVVVLIISLSVFLHYLSDSIDPEGYLGFLLLAVSLLWFIGALIYDWMERRRDQRRIKKDEFDPSDLPIISLALLGVLVSSLTLLIRDDGSDGYLFLSIIFSLIWLLAAIFFILRGEVWRRNAREGLKGMSLPEGSDILRADRSRREERGKPLRSARHFLIGMPDIIIEEEGLKVPVEFKSGKPPFKPHFSHVMQLGAYLILVDEQYHQTSTHGYIEYGPDKDSRKRFRMEWDMITKAQVLSKVSEIRDSERSGMAHRNHNRPGKCRSCSRRNGCPERLN